MPGDENRKYLDNQSSARNFRLLNAKTEETSARIRDIIENAVGGDRDREVGRTSGGCWRHKSCGNANNGMQYEGVA